MNLLIIHSKEWFYCDIFKDDPLTYAIQSSENWFFVNPLVYFGFDDHFKSVHQIVEPHITAITSERAIVSASCFMFVDCDRDPVRKTEKDSFIKDALSSISRFFVNLRYVSKQIALPTGISSFFSITHLEISHLPPPYFPVQISDPHVMLQKTAVDTAITRKQLGKVATYLSNFKPPIFDTILLDAIQAFSDGDYKRTILYSAMSVEIIATTKLYSQANFAKLLHERSLHVLNKSLLLDNEQLYQTARKLYRTRNKIAHQGEPPSEEGSTFFAMSETDARLALECAIEVFKWFGEFDQYAIPGVGLLSSFCKIGELINAKLQ